MHARVPGSPQVDRHRGARHRHGAPRRGGWHGPTPGRRASPSPRPNPGSTFLPMDLPSLPKGELFRLLNEVREAADTGRGSYVDGARPGTLYLAELTALVPEDQAALKEFLNGPVPFRLMASADLSRLPKLGPRRFDLEALGAASKITIEIPALRERRGDIPVLIDHFLKRFCERLELKPLGIPASAIDNYSNYDWPGNVAELSMMIERAVSMSGRDTTRAALGDGLAVSAFSAVRARLAITIAHVSASPPLIPDGRISRVRLAAAAFPRGPSLDSRNSSTRLHTPLGDKVIPPARHPWKFPPLTWH